MNSYILSAESSFHENLHTMKEEMNDEFAFAQKNYSHVYV